MYFDPYYIGFFMGALCAVAFLFLILLISAIVSVNKEKKRK